MGWFNPSAFLGNGVKTVGFPAWPRLATPGLDTPLILTFGVISRFRNTFGEVLGWRGFLLSNLSTRYRFTSACLVTGVVWALWHYQLLYALGSFTSSNALWKIGWLTVMVIGLLFVIGWLRFETNSLWPCVLMHATHNALLFSIL
jgi:membrane protease YdiL (CAAX protease family)